MYDLKLALRQFRKSPGFAATVILTISLGIGANVAIFTLVNAILLKSLPVANPASLYRIGDLDDCCINGGYINDNGDFDLFSYDLYRNFQDTTPEFEQLAAMQSGHNTMNVRSGPAVTAERGEYVSGNYFSTFGIGAFAGRMLLPSDDTPGAAPVAVMSYAAWQATSRRRPKSHRRNVLHPEPASHDRRRLASRLLRRPHQQRSHRPLDPPQRRAHSRRPDQHPQTARHQLALRSRTPQARSQSPQPASQDHQQSAPLAGHATALHH